ncbi:UNVERIFIED_CONTAM: Auxin response factor 4 [Sesamum radiatum]|uniref:Auxin response factor 4 n=1 Tax=Sesamum radiatum TaxID=300843 RepID=A0AAW2W5P1_SESRA
MQVAMEKNVTRGKVVVVFMAVCPLPLHLALQMLPLTHLPLLQYLLIIINLYGAMACLCWTPNHFAQERECGGLFPSRPLGTGCFCLTFSSHGDALLIFLPRSFAGLWMFTTFFTLIAAFLILSLHNLLKQANKENDEVYTQLSLLPLSELVGLKLEGKESENTGADEDGNGVVPAKSTSHMFCKTLTASDTSTHGGFSVPRRAAEDCFPPLDYKEQRPSQELIAKDLHGVEWKFRHIYRGQPRRHLLTTGWSIFVSQKNLVSGDAVLFLRFSGVVTGFGDMDPYRWPNSKWRCLMVHKQGSLVGRAIDLLRLHGYDDLLVELERLFSMEGLLRDPNNGWRILYTDSENDMMVVGDDPWHEFVEVVTKIHIYTQEEVEKLTIGMNSDDTKSCLEEAPPAPDVSKSSSVGQPDSSPTVVRM